PSATPPYQTVSPEMYIVSTTPVGSANTKPVTAPRSPPSGPCRAGVALTTTRPPPGGSTAYASPRARPRAFPPSRPAPLGADSPTQSVRWRPQRALNGCVAAQLIRCRFSEGSGAVILRDIPALRIPEPAAAFVPSLRGRSATRS